MEKALRRSAVQELTSGDNRSAEQLRVAVEQMMLAAGNQNPDVRMTGSAAPKSGATVKVDAQIENEEDVLRDMRAIRLGPSPRPKQKHPTHAPGPAQAPPPGPTQKHPSRARRRSPAPPLIARSQPYPGTASQAAHRSRCRGSQTGFQSPCLLLATMQVIAFRRGPPEGSKMS